VKNVYSRLKMGLPLEVSKRLEEDLLQAGVLGLLQALDKFNEQGVKFESFAFYRIRGAMLDELRKQDWIPRRKRIKLKQMQKVYAELEQKLLRTPDEKEWATALGQSIDEFRENLQEIAPATLIFLDGLRENYSAFEKENFTEDYKKIHGKLEQAELSKKLSEEIQKLPLQEQKVIEYYINEELGQKEIAGILGVSPARISQLYTKAILRLQASMLKYFKD
jgi:RNA polymerase sigma factor FliA